MCASLVITTAQPGAAAAAGAVWAMPVGGVSAGVRISSVAYAGGGLLTAFRVAVPCRNGLCSVVWFELDGVPGPVVAGGGRGTFPVTVSHTTGAVVGAEW